MLIGNSCQLILFSSLQNALDSCEARGGSLVDESNPALQGFLSWELWRRHKVGFQIIMTSFDLILKLIF